MKKYRNIKMQKVLKIILLKMMIPQKA